MLQNIYHHSYWRWLHKKWLSTLEEKNRRKAVSFNYSWQYLLPERLQDVSRFLDKTGWIWPMGNTKQFGWSFGWSNVLSFSTPSMKLMLRQSAQNWDTILKNALGFATETYIDENRRGKLPCFKWFLYHYALGICLPSSLLPCDLSRWNLPCWQWVWLHHSINYRRTLTSPLWMCTDSVIEEEGNMGGLKKEGFREKLELFVQ